MALIPTGRPRSGAPVPAAPARSVLARCALGLRRLRYGVGSITRVAALHLQYPGQVHTEGRVRIDRGCDIRCLPGRGQRKTGHAARMNIPPMRRKIDPNRNAGPSDNQTNGSAAARRAQMGTSSRRSSPGRQPKFNLG